MQRLLCSHSPNDAPPPPPPPPPTPTIAAVRGAVCQSNATQLITWCAWKVINANLKSCEKIDFFHIISADACIGHVARYFPIISQTLHRWGKQILSHLTFYVISANLFVLIIFLTFLFIIKSLVDLGKIIRLFKSQILKKSCPRYAENSDIDIQHISGFSLGILKHASGTPCLA